MTIEDLEKQLAEAQATITALSAEKKLRDADYAENQHLLLLVEGKLDEWQALAVAYLARAEHAEAEQQRLTEALRKYVSHIGICCHEYCNHCGQVEAADHEAHVFTSDPCTCGLSAVLLRTPESRGE